MKLHPETVLTTLACVFFAMPCCGAQERGPAKENELVIISPHDETVRYEISRAFESYAKKRGKVVGIRWQPARGTGNIMRFLENEMESAQSGRPVGIDVFLGGGPAHEKARQQGMTEPIQLPADLLDVVPETLGGIHLRSGTGHWYGVTVSSFGIVYNRVGLKRRGLAEPVSWKDLADPAFSNLLILADPFESGSARACYEMILQRYGWDEGWKILFRMLANAGSFTHSSSDIVREISAGQAVAGMVIDRYAYVQIEKDGPGFVGFSLPRGETTFTPDPVSIIKGTPKKKLAGFFMEFLLSEEGQSLWILRPGEKGGPEKYNLWHFPVRPDVYRKHAGRLTLESNPFESFAALKYDETKGGNRARVLTLMFETAAMQNKTLLRKAWKKVREHRDKKAVRLFNAIPLTEDEGFGLSETVKTPVQMELEEEKFYRFFKKKYKIILDL